MRLPPKIFGGNDLSLYIRSQAGFQQLEFGIGYLFFVHFSVSAFRFILISMRFRLAVRQGAVDFLTKGVYFLIWGVTEDLAALFFCFLDSSSIAFVESPICIVNSPAGIEEVSYLNSNFPFESAFNV